MLTPALKVTSCWQSGSYPFSFPSPSSSIALQQFSTAGSVVVVVVVVDVVVVVVVVVVVLMGTQLVIETEML